MGGRERVLLAAVVVPVQTVNDAVIVGAIVRTLERLGRCNATVVHQEAVYFGASMGVLGVPEHSRIVDLLDTFDAAYQSIP